MGRLFYAILFLSTLPARGATLAKMLGRAFNGISIHAPREGSDAALRANAQAWEISIHAPREGSDPGRKAWPLHTAGFLSTLPARGATRLRGGLRRSERISIHAPREGSDRAGLTSTIPCSHFYPRSPRGERQRYDETGHPYLVFLSTLPARGATRQIRRLEHIR